MFLRGVSLFVFCLLVQKIAGHGMVLEPPNRSSLWRFDDSAPENEHDNRNWCGGIEIQWGQYDGKCGICGDVYGDPHPQDNENTGKYGQGKVVRSYSAGDIIDIEIKVSLNHNGYFDFGLCVLEDPNAPEPGDDCFQPLAIVNGTERTDKMRIDTSELTFTVNTQVQLPEDVTCERCVLRWNWLTDTIPGSEYTEMFRSCSDISIA